MNRFKRDDIGVFVSMDIEDLRSLLKYDPDSGRIFWKSRDKNKFSSDALYRSWNNRYAGKETLCSVNSKGYKVGAIEGLKVQSHRVAWAIHYGEWPKGQIDHINGDRRDNRIKNLRCVTNRQNARNRKVPSTNTTGVVGVTWNKKLEKWVAEIKAKDRKKHIGCFDKFEDAVKARRLAELENGYHPNHGRRM